MYDFLSFPLLRYFTGPTKSTPMKSNGVDFSVRVFGNRPGGEDFAGAVLHFLHPQQSVMILFASLGRWGIQFLSGTLVITRFTPPCNVQTWALCTTFAVNKVQSGK